MKDAVATGFPAGQTPLETNLIEIQRAVESGASEIDIVIYRTKALHGDWKGWMKIYVKFICNELMVYLCRFVWD
ncbi:deoxyribose-phosphate aldolase-like isoform X1 [Styela clava]